MILEVLLVKRIELFLDFLGKDDGSNFCFTVPVQLQSIIKFKISLRDCQTKTSCKKIPWQMLYMKALMQRLWRVMER